MCSGRVGVSQSSFSRSISLAALFVMLFHVKNNGPLWEARWPNG